MLERSVVGTMCAVRTGLQAFIAETAIDDGDDRFRRL